MDVSSFPIGLQMRSLSIWLNIWLKTKNEIIPLKVDINTCLKKALLLSATRLLKRKYFLSLNLHYPECFFGFSSI